MFEKALRTKLRFPSNKGELNAEQIWDLPLRSKNGFDLDTVARDIARTRRDMTEESFVDDATNPAKARIDLAFELVLHVIATKKKELAAAETAADRRLERKRLEEILHLRTQQDLMSKSPAEIQAMLDALGK